MQTHTVEREVPFRPEQLFDLVADVERYPEFVPWWVAARVRRREEGAYYTDQVIRVSMVSQRFTTRTALRRPDWIDVTSDEKPFKKLEIRWRFEPAPGGRCRVRLDLLFHFKSVALGKMLGIVSGEAAHMLINAFEERARSVYGEAPLGLQGVVTVH